MHLMRGLKTKAKKILIRSAQDADEKTVERSESKTQRIFCVSIQRTGTTSVGQFFRDHGLRSAGWGEDMKNNWSTSWIEGDFEQIFNSPDFIAADAYEDSPWFLPEFYKMLYHRFPNSKFILFTRNPREWFRSMLAHSGGTVLGAYRGHAKIYRREEEYFRRLDEGELEGQPAHPDLTDLRPEHREKMTLHGFEDHYVSLYNLHNREVVDFFERNSPQSLFTARLEDLGKWVRLGEYLGINVDPKYEAHLNRSEAPCSNDNKTKMAK